MDTITHGIVGALIGKAFFADDPAPIVGRAAGPWRMPPKTAGRVAIVSATIGAIFPDIDVFAGPLAHNPLAIMTWHRDITHSIVLLPVWALLLALITRWLANRLKWPAPSWSDLSAIYAVGLASHIFLDVLTSFGTMIWSPISHVRVSWDWLFIVDLTVTSLALLPQLAAWAYRRPDRALRRAIPLWVLFTTAGFAIAPLVRSMGRTMEVSFPPATSVGAMAVFTIFFLLPLRHRTKSSASRGNWCRAGVALLVAYIGFAGAMHHTAFGQVEQFADEARMSVQNIAALPLPPWAARWEGMIAVPEGVYRLQFNELGDEPIKIRLFSTAAPDRYVDEARSLRDVQTFLWFARFPVFKSFERDAHHVVQITDLRFYGMPARSQGNSDNTLSPDAPSGFTFEVVFTPDGQVVHQGFVR